MQLFVADQPYETLSQPTSLEQPPPHPCTGYRGPLATQHPENRAACEDDESRVRVFFHVQDAASAHLDSPGHRLRHFSMAARMLHVFNSSRLASLANLTRHRRSTWWPWPSGLVIQVRVV